MFNFCTLIMSLLYNFFVWWITNKYYKWKEKKEISCALKKYASFWWTFLPLFHYIISLSLWKTNKNGCAYYELSYWKKYEGESLQCLLLWRLYKHHIKPYVANNGKQSAGMQVSTLNPVVLGYEQKINK